MKFQPGDQVSFVNDVGGGIILSVTKNGNYIVAIEDGFDVSCTERELAMVKPAQKKDPPKEMAMPTVQEPSELTGKFQCPLNQITFISVPADENQVFTGNISFYLVNKTAFHSYGVISFVKDKRHLLIANVELLPGQEVFLEKFNRHVLTDWENIHIQLLLFQKEPYKMVLPVKKDIPVLLPDLQFAGKEKGRLAFARHLSVYSELVEEEVNLSELKDNFENRDSRQKINKPGLKKNNDLYLNDTRYGILHNSKVVDLHIDALLKDFQNLSNAEIMEFQLNHFRKEMDHAILNHFHSIVFIHGVGEGILKKQLLDDLRNYSGIKFRNASYQKYGSGAIEILFKD